VGREVVNRTETYLRTFCVGYEFQPHDSYGPNRVNAEGTGTTQRSRQYRPATRQQIEEEKRRQADKEAKKQKDYDDCVRTATANRDTQLAEASQQMRDNLTHPITVGGILTELALTWNPSTTGLTAVVGFNLQGAYTLGEGVAFTQIYHREMAGCKKILER